MQLAELIALETKEPLEAIMLRRHSNESIARLRRFNATIEEYTSIQPIASKYDFHNPKMPRIAVVVVVVDDHVHQPYRVMGVDAEGTNWELASDAYRSFDQDRSKGIRQCRRFTLEPIPSASTGLSVEGWRGRTIAPVARDGHKHFRKIEVDLSSGPRWREAVESSFETKVAAALSDTSAARRRRLARAKQFPVRVLVLSYVYSRDADVVAEVISRAAGVCERCKRLAPFSRRADGTPYLEVHHSVPLAMKGEDTVANALAVCPNCHREAHYG